MGRQGILVLACAAALSACGGRTDDGDGDRSGPPSAGPAGEIGDTSEAGIVAFLKAQTYATWTARQPAAVDGVSAHRGVSRTFFNDAAAAALRAGTTPLPLGSIVVKEMFESDRTTVAGHAVMAKVAEGAAADTWVWLEGFKPDYANPYYGKGLAVCAGCHGAGKDYTRTTVP